MLLVEAPPNFERPGVVAGFALGLGAGLSPTLSKGVLFAQGVIYRPGAAPSLPEAPASQQSWLFYNSIAGFYWLNNKVPALADDAMLGWAVTSADAVIAVSAQSIEIGDASGNVLSGGVSGGSGMVPQGPGFSGSGVSIIHYDLTVPSTNIPAPAGTPGMLVVSLRQDATGGRDVTWDAMFRIVDTHFRPDPTPNSYSIYLLILRAGSYWPTSVPIVGGL